MSETLYNSVLTVGEQDVAMEPITLQEMVAEQASDAFCQAKAATVGHSASDFFYDRHGVLVRRSTLDGALQAVVPSSLRPRVLNMAHYPKLAGHPGTRRMYDTMRRSFYWPLMANDIHKLVRSCQSCAKAKGAKHKHQHKLKLFPAAGPLEEVAMDILGPLPKSEAGNRFVLVITDRYSKMARAIPMQDTTTKDVAQVFVEHWVYPYGIPNKLLTDNGPQFESKLFAAICQFLGVKHSTTTAYHPQTNGQTERYNRTLVERLRHYVSDHQKSWDEYVQPLTYAYNIQVHRSTGTTPYSLVLSRHPPNPSIESFPTVVPTDSDESVSINEMKKRVLLRFAEAIKRADTRSTTQQAQYKRYFDRAAQVAPAYEAGQYVFVNRPPNRALTED